jgi:multiple sugar transport system substrate-binding protein
MIVRHRALFSCVALGLLAALGFWWAGKNREPQSTPGRTVLTWFSVITPLRDHYEAQAREFERLHPNIEVRILWVPNIEYNVKLKTLAAADQSPDIFLSGDVWISYLLPLTLDVSAYVQRDAAVFGLDDFFPQIRTAMQHEGKYYIMPEYMNLSMLYYNRRMFAEAGVPEPTGDWTWADLVENGKRLTHAGVNGQPDIWGCSRMENWWGEWLIYVRQAGGTVFTKDGRRCLLDTPEAIAGLRFYEEKSSRHHISAPAGFEPVNGFVNQRVAMIVGGHVNYWLNYNQMPGLDWDVQLLPAGPHSRKGGELAMAGYSISRTCKHPDEAWELMKFLTRRDAVAEIVARGSLSVRKSVAAENIRGPRRNDRPRNLDAAYAQFEYGEPIPRHPHYIEIMLQIVQPEIDRMILGELTPEQAGHRAAAAVNAFLETFENGGP